MKVTLLECGYCVHPQRATLPGGSLKPVKYPSSVAVIEHPNHGVILFDTGYSNEFFEATKYFPERLYAMVTPVTLDDSQTAKAQLMGMGIKPRDVRYIIISHFHGDHIAGLRDFPEAQYIFLEEGWHAVQKFRRFEAVRRGVLKALIPNDFVDRALPLNFATTSTSVPSAFKHYSQIFGPCYDIFGNGSIVGVPLPGHFPGHMGIAVAAAPSPLFFIGDAAWHVENLNRDQRTPRLTLALMKSTPDYHTTLDRVVHLCAQQPNLIVVPCHCETSIRKFRANSPFTAAHQTL